jgi:hypothetical protein
VRKEKGTKRPSFSSLPSFEAEEKHRAHLLQHTPPHLPNHYRSSSSTSKSKTARERFPSKRPKRTQKADLTAMDDEEEGHRRTILEFPDDLTRNMESTSIHVSFQNTQRYICYFMKNVLPSDSVPHFLLPRCPSRRKTPEIIQ